MTKLSKLAAITALSVVGVTQSQAFILTDGIVIPDGVTGNIGVVSKYVLRGITTTYAPVKDNSGPEMDGPAVQGGIDYAHPKGWYAGYWFSSVGYSYKDLQFDYVPNYQRQGTKSVESDFYAGYNGKFGRFDKWGYVIGGTMYYYYPGWQSTGYETKLGITYTSLKNGALTVTAQTLLNDVSYGNKEDTYWLANYTLPLPKDFVFNGQLAFYTYGKKSKTINGSELVPASGDSWKNTGIAFETKDAFRQATLGISHPLGIKNATWSLQYIFGGYNRYRVKQDNTLVGALNMTF